MPTTLATSQNGQKKNIVERTKQATPLTAKKSIAKKVKLKMKRTKSKCVFFLFLKDFFNSLKSTKF
jgi:hypothetical protein